MRWSYKTVTFELKKEGLLGGTFLDESEIEQSLNEFGAAGWELVSMLETRDGIIAIFKQPLGLVPVEPEREAVSDREEEIAAPRQPVIHERVAREKKPVIGAIADPEEDVEPDSGIGSIRIE
jgi:hypothetical protein